jgi:hypothetical protein
MNTTRSRFASRAALAVFATALLAAPALAADTRISVSIGEPGFYGRIDIGDAPPPVFIYREPIVVMQTQEVEPIYLRVPPGHAKHWKQHCAEYSACGRPVYFVQDDWYSNVYAPHYRKRHGHGSDNGDRGEGHGHGHNH